MHDQLNFIREYPRAPLKATYNMELAFLYSLYPNILPVLSTVYFKPHGTLANMRLILFLK